MIKLIASDMDGTLLQNGAVEPSERMLEMIREMNKMGIAFVAASGRQYRNLKTIFHPVASEMFFIAENGGVIAHGNEILDKTVISREMANPLIRELYACEQFDVVVSSARDVYMQPKPSSKPYIDYCVDELGYRIVFVEDITDIPDDLVKVSALVYHNAASEHAAALHERWDSRFRVAVSGREWVDFTLTTKGEALDKLRTRLNLKREEMMAFGDNYNDESMFQAVHYSYAMHTAVQEIRGMARHCCDTVEDVVQNFLTYQNSLRYEETLPHNAGLDK